MDVRTQQAEDGLMATRTLLRAGEDEVPATRLLPSSAQVSSPVDVTVEPWPPPTPPNVRAYGRRGAQRALPGPVNTPLRLPHLTPGTPLPRVARARSGRRTEEIVALVCVALAVVLSIVAARVSA